MRYQVDTSQGTIKNPESVITVPYSWKGGSSVTPELPWDINRGMDCYMYTLWLHWFYTGYMHPINRGLYEGVNHVKHGYNTLINGITSELGEKKPIGKHLDLVIIGQRNHEGLGTIVVYHPTDKKGSLYDKPRVYLMSMGLKGSVCRLINPESCPMVMKGFWSITHN